MGFIAKDSCLLRGTKLGVRWEPNTDRLQSQNREINKALYGGGVSSENIYAHAEKFNTNKD